MTSVLNFILQPVLKYQISQLTKIKQKDKKAVQSTDIPTKLIKELCDFSFQFIYKSINHYITARNSIADLKETEVCPLYK